MRSVRVGAYGVCMDEGRMLLIRFAGGDPQWSLPGGGVDFGEHPVDGVVREVEEETGYAVRVGSLLGVRSNVWSSTSTHMVSVLYEVHVVGGELRHEVGGSTEEAAWVPVDAVEALPHTDELRAGLDLFHRRPADGAWVR
ncbi:NUDIX hydrolase [Actinopolymorpha rutila]|nr:NUDIX domain-containing protein [Actinopolymorpha rutila]